MNLRIPLANRNPANIKKCLENRNQLTQLQLRLAVARLRTSRLLKEDDVSEISIILFQQTTRNHPQTETTDFSWTAELLNDRCYVSKPVHLKQKHMRVPCFVQNISDCITLHYPCLKNFTECLQWKSFSASLSTSSFLALHDSGNFDGIHPLNRLLLKQQSCIFIIF